jgi:hypothetical protein
VHGHFFAFAITCAAVRRGSLILAQSALDNGGTGAEPDAPGRGVPARRIIAASDYFDIFSLDMLSFDMPSLDI